MDNFLPQTSEKLSRAYIDKDDLQDEEYLKHLKAVRDEEELRILAEAYYDDINQDDIPPQPSSLPEE